MRSRRPEPAPTAALNSNTDIWGMHLRSAPRDTLPPPPGMARHRRGWDGPCGVAAFKSHVGKGDEKIGEDGAGKSISLTRRAEEE